MNTKYVFQDDPTSKTMWVIFSNVNHHPRLKFFRDMNAIPGKKLFIPLTNQENYVFHTPDAHRKLVKNILQTVNNVRTENGIERTIGWGSSRSAYAAILIGCLANFERIVAMAPDLILGAPHTFSSQVISNPDPEYANVLPYIEKFAGKIDLLLPCFGVRDGYNVRLSHSIKNKNCHIFYVKSDHYIGGKVIRQGYLTEMMSHTYQGDNFCIPDEWKCSSNDISIAEASFDLISFLEDRESDINIPVIDDTLSENFQWFHVKSKVLTRKKAYKSAIIESERAVQLSSQNPVYLVHLAWLYARTSQIQKARQACANIRSKPSIETNSNVQKMLKKVDLLLNMQEI